MLGDIKIMQVASALSRHSAERHKVISENIANADTAGYKAKDVEDFGDAYMRSERTGPVVKNASSANSEMHFRIVESQINGAVSPNGNTVSLEDQMMRSVDAQQNHEAATTIYKKAMDILRTSLRSNA